MAKRTTAAKTKKEPVQAAESVAVDTASVHSESDKLHSNEQQATSVAGDAQNTFRFRFWELGALKGKVQGVEVGTMVHQ